MNDALIEAIRSTYFDEILAHTPESETRSNIRRASEIRTTNPQHVAGMVGNGSGISAQDTVPFVVWSAYQYMDNYEEAIWQTAAVGGDVDTTCVMVGGIVACVSGLDGIPALWRECREPLPEWSIGQQDIL